MFRKLEFCSNLKTVVRGERYRSNMMSERQQIIYMQTRMIRLASEEWSKPIETITDLFVKYNVLQYIEECFGIFHVEGDEAVLDDITTYLKNKGVTGDAGIGE